MTRARVHKLAPPPRPEVSAAKLLARVIARVAGWEPSSRTRARALREAMEAEPKP